MKSEAECKILTSEGWKPAPMIEYESPKWYHRVFLCTVGAVLNCLLWIIEVLEGRASSRR